MFVAVWYIKVASAKQDAVTQIWTGVVSATTQSTNALHYHGWSRAQASWLSKATSFHYITLPSHSWQQRIAHSRRFNVPHIVLFLFSTWAPPPQNVCAHHCKSFPWSCPCGGRFLFGTHLTSATAHSTQNWLTVDIAAWWVFLSFFLTLWLIISTRKCQAWTYSYESNDCLLYSTKIRL